MNLIILGAGGYGQTVADIAEQSGLYEKIFFLVDKSTDEPTLTASLSVEIYDLAISTKSLSKALYGLLLF